MFLEETNKQMTTQYVFQRQTSIYCSAWSRQSIYIISSFCYFFSILFHFNSYTMCQSSSQSTSWTLMTSLWRDDLSQFSFTTTVISDSLSWKDDWQMKNFIMSSRSQFFLLTHLQAIASHLLLILALHSCKPTPVHKGWKPFARPRVTSMLSKPAFAKG